jgi:hypothetical protein
VLEDDSALASPDSEFSSESGSLGVREGAGEGGGAFRSGFREAVQPRVGSGSGRGAFRVVGSFTPAPSSAFKAVDKRGSASEVEEASERLRRDRKVGKFGTGWEFGTDAIAAEGRVRVRRVEGEEKGRASVCFLYF